MRQQSEHTVIGHTVHAIVIEQRQSDACTKQGMVSVVKTEEAAVASVLCICAQTITIVISCD